MATVASTFPLKTTWRSLRASFRRRGLDMTSRELLTSACLWIKNQQSLIPKTNFSENEAHSEYVVCISVYAFNTTHNDSERKTILVFDLQTHQNQWKYIVIFLSNGLWKVHYCNIVQNDPHYGSSKKLIKPAQYCSFAPRGFKIKLSRFLNFQQIHQILTNGPWGLPWSARRPHGPSRGPTGEPPTSLTSIKNNANEHKIM